MAAILASTGVTAMAITAVYFRFTWHMRDGADFPMLEAAATLLLTFGGRGAHSTLLPARACCCSPLVIRHCEGLDCGASDPAATFCHWTCSCNRFEQAQKNALRLRALLRCRSMSFIL